MTFHIKIMVAHQHDQSIFTWGKLPPLLLCMRMSRLTHKKGERIKKKKELSAFSFSKQRRISRRSNHRCSTAQKWSLLCQDFVRLPCMLPQWAVSQKILASLSQLDKHTQWETLSGLRLCPRGDLPLGRPVAVHAAKTVNTKPSICSLTGSMELQHRQPC